MAIIGLLQGSSTPSSEENLSRTVLKIEAAAQKGAQIVCLGELFRSKYFCQVEDKRYFDLAETIPGPTTETLSPLARKLGIVLIASIFEKEGSQFYNTAVPIDADGKVLGKYRKVHIPDDLKNYYGESFYFKKGDLGYPIFKTRYATIGLQVCYDQWFPEGARVLAQAGAEIIFYPTAIGWPDSGKSPGNESEYDAWLTIQRGHAISNGVFVAACNRVGREDHINFWGSSFACDPMGKLLAKGSSDKEEILIVQCDLGKIEEVRRDWPFLKEC